MFSPAMSCHNEEDIVTGGMKITENNFCPGEINMSKKRTLSKYDKHKYGWLHFALELVAGTIVFLVIASFVIGVARVDGVSMEPTLKDSQIVVFLRNQDTYQRGDIIAIRMPEGDSYVKRVIALPGDTVDIHDGAVYVNGELQNEPYIQGPTEVAIGSTGSGGEGVGGAGGTGGTGGESADGIGGGAVYPLEVPEGKIFVLGDNRPESVDSREFGPVSYTVIKGKLVGRK